MRFSLRRLRPPHLAAIIGIYWVGLAVAALARPIGLAWRLAHLPPPAHSSIEAGFTDTLFHVTMTQSGTVVWGKSIYLATLLMWVLGPPALVVLGWRSSRKAAASFPDADESSPSLPHPTEAALPAPPLDLDLSTRQQPEPAARPEARPDAR